MEKKQNKKSVMDLVEGMTEKFRSIFSEAKTSDKHHASGGTVDTDYGAVEGREHESITAPLAGIFHSSLSSGSSPYVEAGSIVRKGEILCVIEAMKMMNEIESEASGTLLNILVENGQSVEKGQPLFIIEPRS